MPNIKPESVYDCLDEMIHNFYLCTLSIKSIKNDHYFNQINTVNQKDIRIKSHE